MLVGNPANVSQLTPVLKLKESLKLASVLVQATSRFVVVTVVARS